MKSGIFDTLLDTQKINVSVTTRFNIRTDLKRKDKLAPIYLFISGNNKKERINLKIYVSPKAWDKSKEMVKPIDKQHEQAGAIVTHLKSVIGQIRTKYYIDRKNLTPEVMAKEIFGQAERTNFIAFFRLALKEDRTLKKGTKRRYESVVNKLEEFSDFIAFADINEVYLDKYRNHLFGIGNNRATVNSNMMAIKKYLRRAKKEGIKIDVDLDDVKIGSTNGNREALLPEEVKSLMDFYYREPLDSTASLVTGYFLFACMTGLRISDVLKMERSDFKSGQFSIITSKVEKGQTISLNNLASRIIEHNRDLFVKKISDVNMNLIIKRVAKECKIDKRITFHVARHTFATNFLRAGGKVEHLQKLLNHAKISTSMIYVHILSAEANAEIFKLDNLYK